MIKITTAPACNEFVPGTSSIVPCISIADDEFVRQISNLPADWNTIRLSFKMAVDTPNPNTTYNNCIFFFGLCSRSGSFLNPIDVSKQQCLGFYTAFNGTLPTRTPFVPFGGGVTSPGSASVGYQLGHGYFPGGYVTGSQLGGSGFAYPSIPLVSASVSSSYPQKDYFGYGNWTSFSVRISGRQQNNWTSSMAVSSYTAGNPVEAGMINVPKSVYHLACQAPFVKNAFQSNPFSVNTNFFSEIGINIPFGGSTGNTFSKIFGDVIHENLYGNMDCLNIVWAGSTELKLLIRDTVVTVED